MSISLNLSMSQFPHRLQETWIFLWHQLGALLGLSALKCSKLFCSVWLNICQPGSTVTTGVFSLGGALSSPSRRGRRSGERG